MRDRREVQRRVASPLSSSSLQRYEGDESEAPVYEVHSCCWCGRVRPHGGGGRVRVPGRGSRPVTGGTGGNVLETQTILAGQLPSAPACTVDGCGVRVGFARPEADISSITFGPSSSPGDAFAIDDVRFNADVIPLTAGDCKKGGWTRFHIDGVTFKNQGDCVSYLATGGRNQPAG